MGNIMSKNTEIFNIKNEVTRYLNEEFFPSDEFRQLVKENILGIMKQSNEVSGYDMGISVEQAAKELIKEVENETT